MNRTTAVVSLIVGMAVGAALFHGLAPFGVAKGTPAGTYYQTPQSSGFKPLNGGQLLTSEQNTVDIVKTFRNGVVYVSTISQSSPSFSNPASQLFGSQPSEIIQGTGSGFFINKAGDVLTNYHVVAGAQKITVKLPDSSATYKAKVIGTAPDYDLALIRVLGVPKNLITPMVLGNSAKIQVGQKAIAMGNPFDLAFTVTQGIVSAVNRVIPTGVRGIPQKAIQTDAPINPGNSGGPLLDSAGEVIGINTQIVAPGGSGTAQSAGLGFAIPINVAKTLLPRLEAGQTIHTPELGVQIISLRNLSSNVKRALNLPQQGELVVKVLSGSPAAQAGIQGASLIRNTVDGQIPIGGDVIVSINGQPVRRARDLQDALLADNFGQTVRLGIIRNGKAITVDVKLFPIGSTQ
jgi:S1-C subfamily serine protease